MRKIEQTMEKEPKIEIVPAVPEDARGIQEVFYRAWLATYPNEEFGVTVADVEDRFKNAFAEDVIARKARQIANPSEGHALWTAKDGDKVIGFCRVIKDQEKNQLQAIYILPDYQNRGIGGLFWKEAKNFFDSQKDIVVQVTTYNTKAIEFYKKLGFQDTGKRWNDEKFKMKSGAVLPEMELVIKGSGK